MSAKHLDFKSKELVALGAAIGANCIPCLEWHFGKCLELGLSKEELRVAIAMANKVKSVPADKITETAEALLDKAGTE